jgi:hypothetical protein
MEIPMTVPKNVAEQPRPNRLLLAGCAASALIAAVSQLHAQAFNATPKTVAGAVSYDRATPGVETITIDTSSAIINWTPTNGVFLPAGNVATFTNGVSNGDYVVLNRVLTATPIRFDGTVISVLQNFAQGTSAPGGTILFSSPGGIIIGSTALFDVGSLVLTTLDVVDDGTGNFYDPASQGLFFNNGAANPNAAVIVEPGARIQALTQGSFVAILAPRIVQGGSVRVNGSAAYVAGEQVQMRVNQGLFDIIVDTGSANATPLIHTGSTGGPASTGPGDIHNIFMVAVPKNVAITAILQGNVGFDPAVDAQIENGAIILSAGYSVAGGQVDRYGDFGAPPPAGPSASFEIRGGAYTSDLFGSAFTDMLASGGAVGGSLKFLQDVRLFGARRAHLFAGQGQTVSVSGNALVSSSRFDSADPTEFDLTGGEALIFANLDGSVTIDGNATVDASARGIVDQVGSRAGNGTGGTAGIFADTGQVRILGGATVLSTGQGGFIDFAPMRGGTGQGGAALVEGRNGGSVQVGGPLVMDVSGTGTRSSGGAPGQTVGAGGTGGAISVAAIGGGSVTLSGTSKLTANGTGGEVLDGPGNLGGEGRGGTIAILANGSVTFIGATGISANAQGGTGPIGGAAIGGRVTADANGGQADFKAAVIIDANATGGDAVGVGGAGGNATGGDVLIRARAGATASRLSGGTIAISARGTGGTGAIGTLATPAGRGGDGRGGTIEMLAEAGNGTLQLGAANAVAIGTGGRGGNTDLDGQGGRGGDGFGGSVRAGSTAGPAASQVTGAAQFASLDLNASALGGQGGGGGGTGGNAVGGTSALLAAGIPTTIAGNALLTADATGGTGGNGAVAGSPSGPLGLADGGTLTITATGFGASPATLTAGNVTGTANATGGPGSANSPGEWHVGSSGGSTVRFANLTLTAQATGTPAVRPFSSLDPQGGTIEVTQVAALSTQGEIRIVAGGNGRITGGRLGLTAGDDVTISHAAPAAGALTVDVANFFVTAGDDFSVGAGAVTRASTQTDIRARDSAVIAGRMIGQQILIASSDIDLPATGAIGDAATELVTLLPNDTGQAVVLGGTTQGPGYTLTNAEAGRIRAGTLRLSAPALTSTALIVRDLAFNGGGAASGIGLFEVNTAGIARVEGALSMANAGAGNGISLTARARLEVVTPTGSVRVRDGAGAPGGNLLLSSNNIWIATPAVIDQLRLNANYAGRDEDLRDNGGIEEPRGFVEGGTVVLATGGTLFVQNSGPPFSPAFAGVTAGPGGLTVRPTGAAPVTVTAFGRGINADGSVTLATPFFLAVDFPVGPAGANGPGYTLGSTFNTCVIVTRQCGAAGGVVVVQPAGSDPITGPVGGSDAIVLPGAAEAQELVDTSFSNDPLIEEPVTSGGESSLWECDADRDGDCDDEDH